MLRLLLDEHVSPAVAEGARRNRKGLSVHGLAEWEGGRLLGQSDEFLLSAAAAAKLTLLTYDRRTIPSLLKTWIESGRSHGGVVFVDQKSIPSSDFGGLIRAIHKLFQETGEMDWTGLVYFLSR